LPSKSKNRKLRQYFRILKWKWYLVDLRDVHKPVIVRKHLDNREQAVRYRDKYYDDNFTIIYYKDALRYGIRDYPTRSTKHHKWNTAKYDYPKDCVTQYQRQLFRNNQRNRMRVKKRIPKLTESKVWEIIDEKPVLFVKRLKRYKRNHFPLSIPIAGVRELKKKFTLDNGLVDYNKLRDCCNILRTLDKYYNVGIFNPEEVAIFIYNKWGKRIKLRTMYYNPMDLRKVGKEFKARGFIPKNGDKIDYHHLETIHIDPPLYLPVKGWHNHKEKDSGEFVEYIYKMGELVGIPGFTNCVIVNTPIPAKKSRRK